MKTQRRWSRTKTFSGAVLVGLILLSLFLRWKTIERTSPTFDEPYYLYEGVHYRQYHAVSERNVHLPFLPWFVGQLSPLAGDFQDARAFSQDQKNFQSPYQYRMDEFSRVEGTGALDRLRFLFQPLWIVSVFAFLFAARRLGMDLWGRLTLGAFLLLEPAFLGYSCLIGVDSMEIALLGIGTALALLENQAAMAGAVIVFGMAWATKFTALLWGVPLVIGWGLRKIPRQALLCWGGGALLAGGWAMVSGSLDLSEGSWLMRPNFRMGFLDGLVFVRTPWTFFIQSTLCKASLALLGLLAWILWDRRDALFRERKAWLAGGALLASFLGASQFLPGLGVRMVLPLVLGGITLLCFFVRNKKVASAVILALSLEMLWNQDRILAYQDPLAGETPRILDSHRDWGQGLKELARWRGSHPSEPLALSLFGGTPPETYGVHGYRSLASFPQLVQGEPLVEGQFAGYVAVSENFLQGYVVDDPSLRMLGGMKPVRCFQGTLCLFDVRKRK